MPPAPLVSVVVPVWNGEAFLAETLASALAQTLADLEVIVVDDGSTDGSLSAARAFERDPRVRVLAGPHRGVSASRNAALATARGRFIAFLDADDLWDPGYLRSQVDLLAANPGRFAYASGVRFGDGPDAPFGAAGYVPATSFRDLYPGGHVPTPSVVVASREDVLAAGGFLDQADGPLMEDIALWLTLCARGVRPLHNPFPGVRYRQHAAQLTRDLVRHHRGKLATRLRFRDAVAGDPPTRLIPEAEADAAIARIELELAHALAERDPTEAAAVARSALGRHPALRSDARWRRLRRKLLRARLRRWPLLGPLLARRRGGDGARGDA